MKILYIECRMGCAGDMLMGALSELVDQQAFVKKMNDLHLPGIKVEAVSDTKCGIAGTHMKVSVQGHEEGTHLATFSFQLDHLDDAQKEEVLKEIVKIEHMQNVSLHENILQYDYDHDKEAEAETQLQTILKKVAPQATCDPLGHIHHHHETHIKDINHLIDHLNVGDDIKKDAKAVYALLADAESRAHGMKVDQIHFHEVGTLDALADVVGNCMLFHMIDADRVYVSPIATGSGMVKCAHGIMPVPAPATAYLLEGMPSYSGKIEGELTTPTGAALLKYFADSFDDVPPMRTEEIGYGLGTKDFPAANCVRAFIGDVEDDDEVVELVCNLDDEDGEAIGYARKQLMENGALDVYLTSIQMKKNRPGIMLTCMCRLSDKEKMLRVMFKHLTTLGIREYTCQRHTLTRTVTTIHTSLGDVHIKKARGYGVQRYKLEYEDLSSLAEKLDLSIDEVRKAIERELD